MSGESRVTIVGAGAAGLMAAVSAARCGADVQLLERNVRPGQKLAITGKGRCNVTNDCDTEEFLSNCNDGRFLRSALSRFSPQDTITFFESIGVPLVTERGRRVFPRSEKADDIISALTAEAERSNVRLIQKRVSALPSASPVILCTGGLSYPKTGSAGDGHAMARQAGHTITPLLPSLVPLESPDPFCAELQGLSLRNVTLSLTDGRGGAVWQSPLPGEMLFTHFGVSGPLVLSASSEWRPGRSVCIDLKPGLTGEALSARIDRDFIKYGARELANALGDLLHKRMIPVIIDLAGLDPRKRTAEITRAERLSLMRVIKCLPVSVSGTRPISEAVVTRGGICLKEVDPRTMGSKLRKGLYFAGELLDLDGYTGGYNLQIAWTTGYIAGISAAKEVLS